MSAFIRVVLRPIALALGKPKIQTRALALVSTLSTALIDSDSLTMEGTSGFRRLLQNADSRSPYESVNTVPFSSGIQTSRNDTRVKALFSLF